MHLGAVVLTTLVVSLIIFWGINFVQLMCLSEADFPGKHDKILWVVVFLLLFFLAPFLFVFWKGAYQSVRDEEARSPRNRIR